MYYLCGMRPKARKIKISREEFDALLQSAGLSKNDLCRLGGYSENTPQRWAAGDNTPLPVLIILRLLQERPELKELINSISEEF